MSILCGLALTTDFLFRKKAADHNCKENTKRFMFFKLVPKHSESKHNFNLHYLTSLKTNLRFYVRVRIKMYYFVYIEFTFTISLELELLDKCTE